MNMSRRMFLGGAIAVVGAAALPKLLTASPAIYGDGVHDDWEGIDALWNGRPVRMLTDTVSVSPDGIVEMIGGEFRLSKTLDISGAPQTRVLRLIGSRFTWTEPVDYAIRLDPDNRVHIMNNHFVLPTRDQGIPLRAALLVQ